MRTLDTKRSAILAIFAILSFAIAPLGAQATVVPLPSEFGGGNYNYLEPKEFKAAQRLQGNLGKAAFAVSRCYAKSAGKFAKGSYTAADLNSCIQRANDQYDAKSNNLSLANCNTAGDGIQGDFDTVAAAMKGLNAAIYCQSPSGAFLDEVTL
jgi:hypothetical protein